MGPGLIWAVLFAKKEFSAVAVVMFIEAVIVFIRYKTGLLDEKSRWHDWVLGIGSSIGIVIGFYRYPVRSFPQELGIAALILILVIHFSVYLILCNIAVKDQT